MSVRPFLGFVRALRPAQWLKNVPVGAGLLFGGKAGDAHAAGLAAGTFAAFCALASAGYLVNDVVDREADRAHPLRRTRPVAAGDLTPRAALSGAALLLAAGVASGFAFLGSATTATLAAYAVLSLSYTLALRLVPGVGPVAVAAGFVLRVLAGTFAVDVPPSTWLLALTAVLALALATAKREAEARRDRGEAPRAHRAATDALLAGSAAGYLAYALWPSTVALHGTHALAWTALPVAAALARFRALLRRDRTGRGPAEITAGDPLLLALGAAWIVACALILRDAGRW